MFFTKSPAIFCEIIANLSYSSTMLIEELAIIGPTASGKTDLAIHFALKNNALILSLDSLSVYKDIDIASAKPRKEERKGIVHFGIDCINVNEKFNAQIFINEYLKAKEESKQKGKKLIIVGGTSFYLKSLLNGLSNMPNFSKETKQKVNALLQNRIDAYELLKSIDAEHAKKISPSDSFRMKKALEIYFETSMSPSEYFMKNPANPIIKNIKILNIMPEREILRERIVSRTNKMLESGIIDEAANLEAKFGRIPKPMHSIGIKEVLGYLDGHYSKKIMTQLISTHTAQLAKRQLTFNKGQFPSCINGSYQDFLTQDFFI